MLHGLFIANLIYTVAQFIKEGCKPTIPLENWENKDLIHKDKMSGISNKEFEYNLAKGKYKMAEKYPEPHRNENGQIMIENCKLYNEDLVKYGAVQTMQWAKQGKYNLEGEELKKERERIKKKFDDLYSINKIV